VPGVVGAPRTGSAPVAADGSPLPAVIFTLLGGGSAIGVIRRRRPVPATTSTTPPVTP
ncbi:MAG: hypothetical protein QOG43_2498, partial [Actinomycetota bacterium]|nr:hypothetical protein [Actinomycetota bacterium]